MLQKKTGFPEENELVLCTVTKVQMHTVFVNLDEYNKGGIIHISEISPGRIRNIRDFVKEGKVIVCKVLRVNEERGHIDLSLRRVNDNQRRNKVNELKQEQIAEKILEYVAQKNKLDVLVMYNKIVEIISDEYDSLYALFEEVVEDNKALQQLKLDKKINDELLELILQRIKPSEVVVTGTLKAISYNPSGIEDIKKLAKDMRKAAPITMKYLGGGKYIIQIVDSNYPDAEAKIKKAVSAAEKFMKSIDGEMSFQRAETS